MTIFSATDSSILNRSEDGNVETYATTSELEKKEYTVYSQNIKQTFGIQVTLILEIKLQK